MVKVGRWYRRKVLYRQAKRQHSAGQVGRQQAKAARWYSRQACNGSRTVRASARAQAVRMGAKVVAQVSLSP